MLQLFDISTTVDPSHIISLIRKLLPVENGCHSLRSKTDDLPSSDNGNNLDDLPSSDDSSVVEATWEEFGCTLWDLAANETHAELMVFVLFVGSFSCSIYVYISKIYLRYDYQNLKVKKLVC